MKPSATALCCWQRPPRQAVRHQNGESLFAARTKCLGLTVVPPDFDWYVQNSKALIQILNDYTPGC